MFSGTDQLMDSCFLAQYRSVALQVFIWHILPPLRAEVLHSNGGKTALNIVVKKGFFVFFFKEK